jgi:hypothetical protein
MCIGYTKPSARALIGRNSHVELPPERLKTWDKPSDKLRELWTICQIKMQFVAASDLLLILGIAE